MKKSKAISKGKAPSGKGRFYKRDDLYAMAEEMGYRMHRPIKQNVFVLTDPASGEWCWILHPQTGRIVGSARSLERDEWRTTIQYNIARLNETIQAKK